MNSAAQERIGVACMFDPTTDTQNSTAKVYWVHAGLGWHRGAMLCTAASTTTAP